jgi:hypothetical protein
VTRSFNDFQGVVLKGVIALGPLDPALDLQSLGKLHVGTFDKSSFSMITPEVRNILNARPAVTNVVLFGIEVRDSIIQSVETKINVQCSTPKSHICVLQTALDLLSPSEPGAKRYTPFVIADCLASHNRWEVPIAIERMRGEGAKITTSESIAFELFGSASHPQFRTYSKLTKDWVEATERVGQAVGGVKL